MKGVKIRNLAAKSPLLRKGGAHRDRRQLERDARQQRMEAWLAWEDEPWEVGTEPESLEPSGSPPAKRAWRRPSWPASSSFDASGPGRFGPVFRSPIENNAFLRAALFS